MPEAPIPPLPLPQDDDRQLGLYDDPDDLDAIQQQLDDLQLSPEDDEDDSELPPLPVDAPDPEPEDNTSSGSSPIPTTSSASARATSEPTAPHILPSQHASIPGLSKPDHPLLAHALNLPKICEPRSPEVVYASSHDLWFVRDIVLLTTFLHTHHHVTFRACDLILSTMRTIFEAFKLIDKNDKMPETLTTALKHLDLEDRFHVLIECTQCRRLFQPNIPNPQVKCPYCEVPLYHPVHRSAIMRICRRTPRNPIPKTVVPLRLLSAALAYLVKQPGMEVLFDSWRSRAPLPEGTFNCMQDARRWNIIKAHDGKPFFGPDYNDELRIAVIFHIDWCVILAYMSRALLRRDLRFSAASSAFSASYSTGALSFSLPNLPPAVRYVCAPLCTLNSC